MSFCDRIVVDKNADYGIKISDVSFNKCVDFTQFELSKILRFKPPLGTTEVMRYRISKDFNYPYKIHSYLTEKSNFKFELTIKVSLFLPKTQFLD